MDAARGELLKANQISKRNGSPFSKTNFRPEKLANIRELSQAKTKKIAGKDPLK